MLNVKSMINEINNDIKDKHTLEKYLLVGILLVVVLYFFVYNPVQKKLKNARRRASNLYRKAKSRYRR